MRPTKEQLDELHIKFITVLPQLWPKTGIVRSSRLELRNLQDLSGIHCVAKRFRKNTIGTIVIERDAKPLLGLLRIEGAKRILVRLGMTEPVRIVNQHMDDKDINLCQEDLIEAGFGKFAKLWKKSR